MSVHIVQVSYSCVIGHFCYSLKYYLPLRQERKSCTVSYDISYVTVITLEKHQTFRLRRNTDIHADNFVALNSKIQRKKDCSDDLDECE